MEQNPKTNKQENNNNQEFNKTEDRYKYFKELTSWDLDTKFHSRSPEEQLEYLLLLTKEPLNETNTKGILFLDVFPLSKR